MTCIVDGPGVHYDFHVAAAHEDAAPGSQLLKCRHCKTVHLLRVWVGAAA